MQKWIILIVVILIIIIGGIIVFNARVETEIIPEEEISSNDLRKTMVNLYYRNKATKEITQVSQLIDSKELIGNPYYTLVEMLMKEPENSELERIIPEDIKLVEVSLEKDVVTVEFSSNIVKDESIDASIVDSVTKTLKQLNEVENVIIKSASEESNNEKNL